MQNFGYLLIFPFLYINYKIIISDIKYKIIPNKYLGYLLLLLPFWWGFLFINPDFIMPGLEINFLLFFGHVIITFLISFVLYYFGVWSAGDAKYLLVLALFIAHIGIIPFIGNIALLTIGYLLLYFIWFYFGRCLFNWRYTKSLYENIYNDLKDKSITFLKHGDGNFYKKLMFLKILKWILLFLIIFVSIRLARLYIFADIMKNNYYMKILNYLQDYNYYIILILIGLFFGVIYLIRLFIYKIKYFISKTSKIKNNLIIDFILISILLVLLISFIVYEYKKNPQEIIKYLTRILNLYLLLYLIFKILKYSYKVTFQLAEQDTINIKDLKEGDIVDKNYLISLFGEQISLGYCHETIKEENIIQECKKLLLYPNPKEYFIKLTNPIDYETKNKLTEIYNIVNKYHKKQKTLNFTEINSIKILRTFSFGGYIFIGFIISFIIGNKIFLFFINLIIKYFRSFHN